LSLYTIKPAFDKFIQFATPGNFLSARILAASAFVIPLDGECFPSHTRILQVYVVPVVKFLRDIMMSFGRSPFVQKVWQVP
jgi:hypothetical protein